MRLRVVVCQGEQSCILKWYECGVTQCGRTQQEWKRTGMKNYVRVESSEKMLRKDVSSARVLRSLLYKHFMKL